MAESAPVVIGGMIQWPEELHEEIRSVLAALTQRSRQDDGCLEYHWSSDLERPGVFQFFEAWSSTDAYEQHRAADYEHEFMATHASRAISAAARQFQCTGIVELASET